MAQTVGIRLNMLASSQAPALSKSIKPDFITTAHMLVGRGGEVVGLTERREKYLHEKGERFWREEAASCQVLLLTTFC